MSERDARRLRSRIERISDRLPERARDFVQRLAGPSARAVRLPIALLLILGGIVGFLPVLGFWMVPLGVLLLAQDVPFLRRPTLRVLTSLRRKWTTWRRRPRR